MRVSVFSVLLLVCYLALANAVCPDTTANIIRWSAWSGAPTTAGATVTVGANDVILLDVSPPVIQKLDILGTLVVDPSQSITLGAYFIYVKKGGHFYAGSEDCPHTGKFEVVLYGSKQVGVNPDLVGTKVFGVFEGGELDIHGATREITWSTLDATVNAGDASLTLSDKVDWAVGETIVLAGTDFYDSDDTNVPSQSEVVTITAVDTTGKIVTFTPAVKYTHWGQKWIGDNGDTVDTRGEVGLLTRNIIIHGDNSNGAGAASWGGHIMIRDGGHARLAYMEVYHMGQLGELGRYAIHYHNGSNQDASYIVGCAIHDTYQRSVTVHSTHKLTLRDNVAFRSRGHMFFIEDGNEEQNVFDHNLGINPLPIEKGVLLDSDSEPSVFWITNPNNHFYHNVASEGKMCFWYAMPTSPLALSSTQVNNVLRFKLNGDFFFNKAYACHDGLFVDRGQENALPGSVSGLTSYNPTDFTKSLEIIQKLQSEGRNFGDFNQLSDLDEYSLSVFGKNSPATFVGFTAFKNLEHGMWGRGSRMWSYGGRFADNMIGCIWPGSANLMQSTVFVGETDNVGAYHSGPDYTINVYWEDEEGRNRPFKWFLNMSVVGYSSYDAAGGDLGIDINFHNYKNFVFKSGATRRTGAISGLIGPNVINPNNRLYNTQYFNVDNRVLFRGYEEKYGSDDARNMEMDDAVKGIVWVDADGSILRGSKYDSFGCGAKIVGTSSHITFPGCQWEEAWSAHVCPANYHAYRSFFVSDNSYATSPTYSTYNAARAATDLHLVRLQDQTDVAIEADFRSFGGSSWNAGYSYGTNLIVNQEYLVYVGENKQNLAQFTAHLAGIAAGEWIRLAVPSSTAPQQIIFGWNRYDDSAAAVQVSSKAALVKNSYFYDNTNKILWLHFTATADDISFDYNYGLASGGADVLMSVTFGSNTLVSYPASLTFPTGPAPSGPLMNYCENDGGFTHGNTKVTVTSTTTAILFDDAWVSPWAMSADVETCDISTDVKYSGAASFHCTTDQGFSYVGISKAWGQSLAITGFTHVQMAVRAAPGVGNMKLYFRIGGCDDPNAKSVSLHAPLYSDNGAGISDDRWSIMTVPFTDLGLTQGWANPDCGYIAFQAAEGRPIEYYVDDMKFITATTSLEATVDFPPRPSAPTTLKGPGSSQGNVDPVTGGPGGPGSTTTSSSGTGSLSNNKSDVAALVPSFFVVVLALLSVFLF